jgi:hypothetical protein
MTLQKNVPELLQEISQARAERKTVAEWLREIEDPVIREQAFANLYWEYANDIKDSKAAALRGAFLFSRAPQGGNYWLKIWEGML